MFSTKNIVDFKKTLSTSKKPNHSVELFELLLASCGESHEEFAIAIFGKADMIKYYALRKRLLAKVEAFLKAAEMKEDPQRFAEITGEIFLAQRSIRFQKNDMALQYLKSAEKMARDAKLPGLLDQILFLGVKHSEDFNQPTGKAIESWEENSISLASLRKLEMTFNRIREEIDRIKREGQTPNVELIINEVFHELKIKRSEASNPEFMLTLVATGRSVYASVKDYAKIQPFVDKIFNRLKRANAFGPTHVACELEFLFILAHCSYRNRKFADAQKTIDEIDRIMRNNKGVILWLVPKIVALKAAILCAQGQNNLSIRIVERWLDNSEARDSPKEKLCMQLNLASYYFNARKFREANHILIDMPSDDELIEINGREFALKKNMIAMIVQFELGKDDVAETMNKRILKQFEKMWENPLYALTQSYVKFVGEIIKNPQIVDTKRFQEEIRQTRKNSEIETEDLHAIAFYCLIVSKITHRDYYEVFVERMNR